MRIDHNACCSIHPMHPIRSPGTLLTSSTVQGCVGSSPGAWSAFRSLIHSLYRHVPPQPVPHHQPDTTEKQTSEHVAHVRMAMASGRVGAALRCCTASTEPMNHKVQLGKDGPRMSRIGVGTIAWGDVRKGYGKTFDESTLQKTYVAARECGINFFDTAEVYGYESLKQDGSSEQILARCIETERMGNQAGALGNAADPVVVGTKYFTIPWTNMLVGGGFRLGRQAILDAVQESSKRLNMLPIPLYMIHFPFPTYSQNVLMEGLREAKELGFVDAIGVSNYSQAEMEQAQEILGKHGLSLACNQVKYSLLDRKVEKNGLLDASKKLGIHLVAHSPLEQGKLTTGALGRSDVSDDTKTLLKLLQLIGSLTGGYSIEQVALNYLLAKGVVAIPGCRTATHVQEVAGALDFELDENEVAMIDEKVDYQEKAK